MSKVVKKLVSRDISSRLKGVNDAIVANIVGMTGEENYNIRKTLRDQGIGLMVVKRTMAARATDGTSLRPAFDKQAGSMAVIWGCEDFVSLTRTITKLVNSGQFPKLEIKGGVMDGDALTADQVKKVSKWPSRQEQISLLVGQILSPGATLSGQLVGPARKIAGQVKKLIENQEETGE
ncbi:MAG: 50S ribosomal protein L10 [Pirellula sp.]|jgi:ribosomal protein L10|nr:50S ribosomal protein L10 [Pirellula sp.]MCY3010844.1 50S ribosomal protein L10 [Planctomycetota bacterium]